MYKDLLEVNNKLKVEADVLLKDKGLLGILQKYGTTDVHGSYKLDLMTWRDLDIYVVSNFFTSYEAFELGKEVAGCLKPMKMTYVDERQRRLTPGYPEGYPIGYYWGIMLGVLSEVAWKMDIWMLSEAEYTKAIKAHDDIGQKLTEKTRQIIMEIKMAVWSHPLYRKNFHSIDVYGAVLDDGVTDLDSFKAYLKVKGINL